MKKAFSILLVLAMVMALLAGCGGDTAQTPSGGEGGSGGEAEFVMKLANPNPAGDIKDRVALEFEKLVEERTAAKKAKDFARADALRAKITELGWNVMDTAKGPQLTKL